MGTRTGAADPVERHRYRGVVSRRRVCRGATVAAALAALAACVRVAPRATEVSMGPVTTDHRVEYVLDLPEVTSAAAARALVVRLRVDSGQNNAGPYDVLMAPIDCVAATPDPGFRCTATLPAGSVTRINAAGNHTIKLAAYLDTADPVTGKIGEGAPSEPWAIATAGQTKPPPAAPRNSRFTR